MAADDVLVLGASGHGMVVCDILAAAREGPRVVGFVDDSPALHGTRVLGVPVLGAFDDVVRTGVRSVAMGIGNNGARRRMFTRVLSKPVGPTELLKAVGEILAPASAQSARPTEDVVFKRFAV